MRDFLMVDHTSRITDDSMLCRIRYAAPGDAKQIANIAASVEAKRVIDLTNGFLIYSLTADEYRQRIEDKQHIYVFLVRDTIAGFICGYDAATLERYTRMPVLAHESIIAQSVLHLSAIHGHANYAFLDSIALLPDYQNMGYGEQAFEQFCAVVSGPYFVAMLEGPIRNPRIDYWCRRGFIRIGGVQQPVPERFGLPQRLACEHANLLEWGIYLLPQHGFTPARS